MQNQKKGMRENLVEKISGSKHDIEILRNAFDFAYNRGIAAPFVLNTKGGDNETYMKARHEYEEKAFDEFLSILAFEIKRK